MEIKLKSPVISLKSILMICLSAIMSLQFSSLSAHDKKVKENKKEKIEQLRKKYFNEKLALSDAEQKAFWPLYDEYKKKEKALRDTFKSKYKQNEIVFMDDKKAEEFLNATIKLNDDQNALFKEYIAKFKKVLPVKKVAMLPMVERDFKKEVIKHAGDHKKPGGKGPKGPGPGGPDDGPEDGGPNPGPAPEAPED